MLSVPKRAISLVAFHFGLASPLPCPFEGIRAGYLRPSLNEGSAFGEDEKLEACQVYAGRSPTSIIKKKGCFPGLNHSPRKLCVHCVLAVSAGGKNLIAEPPRTPR
jgi:hypothetical protein